MFSCDISDYFLALLRSILVQYVLRLVFFLLGDSPGDSPPPLQKKFTMQQKCEIKNFKTSFIGETVVVSDIVQSVLREQNEQHGYFAVTVKYTQTRAYPTLSEHDSTALRLILGLASVRRKSTPDNN
jgi:hypothetical protein